MRLIKISLALLFAVSFASSMTFQLTTNVAAQVTFSLGSNTFTVTAVGGGQTQDVTISWINPSQGVQVSATTLNPRFGDFNETVILLQHATPYPAWNPTREYGLNSRVSHNGQNWTNPSNWASAGVMPGPAGGPNWQVPWIVIPANQQAVSLSINLPALQLSSDSVFIPVYSLVDIELAVTCQNGFTGTFQIPRRTLDTLALPFVFDGDFIDQTSVGQNSVRRVGAATTLVSRRANHQLWLSSGDFKNAEIRVVGVNGRVISSQRLNEISRGDIINASNIAAGVYFLNFRTANGVNSTHRFFHGGGDLRVSAAIGGGQGSESLDRRHSTNSRHAAARSANPTYTFRFRHTGEYRGQVTDTVLQVSGRGGELSERVFVSLLSAQLSDIFTREEYEAMFPARFGFGRAACVWMSPDNLAAIKECNRTTAPNNQGDGDYNFFSYEALLRGIDALGEIYVRKIYALNNAGQTPELAYRLVWTNRRTGATREIQTTLFDHYFDMSGRTTDLGIVDYSDFLNYGTREDRLRELAAFFGNVAQETSGATRGVGNYHWAMYWREEMGYTDTSGAYRTQYTGNGFFPPSSAFPRASYHGRGILQLTHPVNYGQFSMFMFGDKQVLLDNPELIIPARQAGVETGYLAFASSIWFWMTSQGDRASPHQVMRPDFVPRQIDLVQNRARNNEGGRLTPISRFGWTVAIINGGLECTAAIAASPRNPVSGCNVQQSGTACDYRVHTRIAHFKHFSSILGIPLDPNDALHCNSMNFNQ